MALEPWDPFSGTMSLREAMDRLIQDTFIRPGAMRWGGQEGSALALDIHETENDYVLHASMPGVKPDDIQIQVVGDTVTIRGETNEEWPRAGQGQGDGQGQGQAQAQGQAPRGEAQGQRGQPDQWGRDRRTLLRERRYGSYSRSITLPMPIDADKAQANYEHGVLTLTLPKQEAAKPRRIQVRGQRERQGQTSDQAENVPIQTDQPTQPGAQTH